MSVIYHSAGTCEISVSTWGISVIVNSSSINTTNNSILRKYFPGNTWLLNFVTIWFFSHEY